MNVLHRCGRRVGVVIFALVTAAVVVRPALSSALVTRGDELSFRGQLGRAREMYRRALLADASNATAADRYAFLAVLSHERDFLESGAAVATAALDRAPGDVRLHMDRALCEQGLRRLSKAAADFEYAGLRGHDPSALTFAALDVAAGNRMYAEHLLRTALAYDTRFLPARRDLARLERAMR